MHQSVIEDTLDSTLVLQTRPDNIRRGDCLFDGVDDTAVADTRGVVFGLALGTVVDGERAGEDSVLDKVRGDTLIDVRYVCNINRLLSPTWPIWPIPMKAIRAVMLAVGAMRDFRSDLSDVAMHVRTGVSRVEIACIKTFIKGGKWENLLLSRF